MGVPSYIQHQTIKVFKWIIHLGDQFNKTQPRCLDFLGVMGAPSGVLIVCFMGTLSTLL